MAVKGWFDDLTPEERKAAFLRLNHSDIGEQNLPRVCLTSLLTRFNLLGDSEIRRHFKEERIPLPPTISKEIEPHH